MTSKTKAEFEEEKVVKHLKIDNKTNSDLKLERFLNWCKQSDIEIDLNKVIPIIDIRYTLISYYFYKGSNHLQSNIS